MVQFRGAWVLIAPALAVAFCLVFNLDPAHREVTIMAGVAIWMAIWWITEVVPLAVTALLPIALYPVLGLMSSKDVAPLYMDRIIMLFIGGFMVALAIEKWGLHKRIALRTILAVGCTPARLLLGMMTATWFLSMWLSNTATAMMMLPIVLAVLAKLAERLEQEANDRVGAALLLGVAYAASIGGVATLIGTPPNVSFLRILHATFPDAPEIAFARWMMFAFPISVIMLLSAWLLLQHLYRLRSIGEVSEREIFVEELQALGRPGYEERAVAVVGVILALLWIFRVDIELGSFRIPGWQNLPFLHAELLHDSTVGIFMGLLLFILPAGRGKREGLLTWEDARRLPWDVVILIGGGFALAKGFQVTGLSAWCGERLAGLGNVSPIVLLVVVCGLMTFLTELTSNTATAEMALPILAAAALAMKVNPLLLMIPATLSASFAFMLPVATPPNAIVFGSGRLRVKEMARAGIWLNLIGIVVVVLVAEGWGSQVLGMDLMHLPAWAGVSP